MIHIILKSVIIQITHSPVTSHKLLTSSHKIRLFFAPPVSRCFLFHDYLKFFSQYSEGWILTAHVLRTGAVNRLHPVLLGGFL